MTDNKLLDKLLVVTPEDLVDYLTYTSYRHNRQESPETTPEQWAAIFGEAETKLMEARYVAETFECGCGEIVLVGTDHQCGYIDGCAQEDEQSRHYAQRVM